MTPSPILINNHRSHRLSLPISGLQPTRNVSSYSWIVYSLRLAPDLASGYKKLEGANKYATDDIIKLDSNTILCSFFGYLASTEEADFMRNGGGLILLPIRKFIVLLFLLIVVLFLFATKILGYFTPTEKYWILQKTALLSAERKRNILALPALVWIFGKISIQIHMCMKNDRKKSSKKNRRRKATQRTSKLLKHFLVYILLVSVTTEFRKT